MKSVAILYIAIGKYMQFWPKFRTSCERCFLPDMQKIYYVFTDASHIPSDERCHVTRVSDEGWPGNTLHRFRFFLQQEKNLASHDFCFFFNANACLLKLMTADLLLPSEQENNLVGLTWRPICTTGEAASAGFPYERDPRSTAYIPYQQGTTYYQGGFFGGTAPAMLQLIRTLDACIDQDEKQGHKAVNNDESHLNRYFLDVPPKCLSIEFGRPEEWDQPADPYMVFLQKEWILGIWTLFRLKRKKPEYLLRKGYEAMKRFFMPVNGPKSLKTRSHVGR